MNRNVIEILFYFILLPLSNKKKWKILTPPHILTSKYEMKSIKETMVNLKNLEK